jgi:hypothetical protein
MNIAENCDESTTLKGYPQMETNEEYKWTQIKILVTFQVGWLRYPI